MNFNYIKEMMYRTGLLVSLVFISMMFWQTVANSFEIPFGFEKVNEVCAPAPDMTAEEVVAFLLQENRENIQNGTVEILEIGEKDNEGVIKIFVKVYSPEGDRFGFIVTHAQNNAFCNEVFMKGKNS